MPPTSTSLRDEGAEIVSFKLVNDGMFDGEELRRYMVDEPAKWPGSSGCRNLADVESDLKAVGTSSLFWTHHYSNGSSGMWDEKLTKALQQIAANHKGVGLIHAIIDDYSLETVQEYMYHIRRNAGKLRFSFRMIKYGIGISCNPALSWFRFASCCDQPSS
jgi:5-oxoprolinase (ATP-hydrolysing)